MKASDMYGYMVDETTKKPFHILRKFLRRDGKSFEKDELIYLSDIRDLKKGAILDDIKFEWIIYDSGRFPYDYELTYTEMGDFTQKQYPEYEFENVNFFDGPSICDCGARVVSGIDDNNSAHAPMCTTHLKKWKDG